MAVRPIVAALALCSLLPLAAATPTHAQDDAHTRRGRKYKAPPDISHIEVVVVKKSNGKPVVNAAVVFHPINEEGKDEGNMEVKTDPEGRAIIDVIPTGSNVRVQVIADGFATYAQDFLVSEPSRQIAVALIRPREQVSAYVDGSGERASQRKPGVQEPVKPDTQKQPATPPKPTPPPPSNTTAPSTSNPN